MKQLPPGENQLFTAYVEEKVLAERIRELLSGNPVTGKDPGISARGL